MNEDNISLIPPNIIKMVNDLDVLRKTINENKKTVDQLSLQFNKMDKLLSKYLSKDIKNILKKKKNKKPSGFATPSQVSDILCKFMDQPINTKISRTSATKYLTKYIKENNLFDLNDKRIIKPNEQLWELIGEEAQNEDQLTSFNIQKYLNKHFTSRSS